MKTFNLRISIANGNKDTGDILALYEGNMRDDIDQTAWNLCDCDDSLQADKFSSLELTNWALEETANDGIVLDTEFSVKSNNDEFIHEVIKEYLDGFADSLGEVENAVYSRTGVRAKANFTIVYSSLEIINTA